MNQNRIAPIIGGLLLVGASWLPVFGSEIGGRFTPLQFSRFEGITILGCGLLGLGFALFNFLSLWFVCKPKRGLSLCRLIHGHVAELVDALP